MKCNQIRTLLMMAAAGMLVTTSSYAQSYNLVMTVAEAPTQTNSTLADTSVETFNSLSVGDHTNVTWSGVGTYNKVSILAANQYGGAAGPGYASGSPYAVASTSSSLGGIAAYTLTLDNPVAYFGLWWSAGDPANVLTFFNGTNQVAQFTTANLVNRLPSAYNGNPTPGSNLGLDYGEKFAFINFFGVSGTTFTSVQFSNLGGSGFENDNNTIRAASYGSDTNDIGTILPGAPIEEILSVNGSQTIITNAASFQAPVDINAQPAPEPGVNALLAMAGVVGAVWYGRRRPAKA